MKRMEVSAARVALPPFDTNELLKIIKQLVLLEQRWIPTTPGHSLYIRPTIIGTRSCESYFFGFPDSVFLFVKNRPRISLHGGRKMSQSQERGVQKIHGRQAAWLFLHAEPLPRGPLDAWAATAVPQSRHTRIVHGESCNR